MRPPVTVALALVALCLTALLIIPSVRAAESKDPEPTAATAPPMASLTVLLVSDGNHFLEQSLGGMELKQFTQVKPADYERTAADKIGNRDGRPFDVIIFDRHRPKRAPVARGALYFGEVPPDANLPVVADETAPDKVARIDAVRAERWDDRHPALSQVQIRRLWVRDAVKLDAARLPPEWNVLIDSGQGPLVLERRRKATPIEPGQNQLVVTFGLDQSNWPMRPGFAVFMNNVVPLLAAEPVVEKKQ